MKPKPVFLLPAVLLLILAGLAPATPGGIAALLLCLSVVCILPVFFSNGWTRWAGVILFTVYMGFAWLGFQDGMQDKAQEIARKLRLEEKQNAQASKGFEGHKPNGEKN